MSSVKAGWIVCDRCDSQFPTHNGYRTPSEARQIAHDSHGWRRRRWNGLTIDLCGECVNDDEKADGETP